MVKFRNVGKWVFWIATGMVIWFSLQPAVGLLTMIQDQDAVRAEVEGIGVWGPVILAAAMVLQLVVALVPGHFLGVAAGYLYGFSYGFLLTWMTVVIAGQILFYLARRFGKPLVYRLTPEHVIDKWEKISQRQGIIFFIFSFSLPIFPADAMIYVAGLSTISGRNIFIAQLIGRIPGLVVMNMVGAYGLELSTQTFMLIIIISIAMFLAWLKYGQHLEAKILNQQVEI